MGIWATANTPKRLNSEFRCRADSAYKRQSRPDYGLGVRVKALQPFEVVPSSLGSGAPVVTFTRKRHVFTPRSISRGICYRKVLWIKTPVPTRICAASVCCRCARAMRLPYQSHLTECIYQLVLESQLPHKIVNLLFTITSCNIKLTVLWGS